MYVIPFIKALYIFLFEIQEKSTQLQNVIFQYIIKQIKFLPLISRFTRKNGQC